MDTTFWDGRVKNPLPAECRIGDYYENPDGWQRRIISTIGAGGEGWYYSYFKIHDTGEWEKEGGEFVCQLAHHRRWSRNGNR